MPMDRIKENHRNYLKRIKCYKKFGYDALKERAVIYEKSWPVSGRMLEVGTGKGYFTMQLAKNEHRFISIDISEEEQNYARMNIGYLGLENLVEFKIENAECLSFGKNDFDIVFSINTMHHFLRPEKSLDEMIKVLAVGGKIVLSDFTPEGFKLIEKIHESEGRKHVFAADKLDKAVIYLKKRSFKIEEYRTKHQKIVVAQ